MEIFAGYEIRNHEHGYKEQKKMEGLERHYSMADKFVVRLATILLSTMKCSKVSATNTEPRSEKCVASPKYFLPPGMIRCSGTNET